MNVVGDFVLGPQLHEFLLNLPQLLGRFQVSEASRCAVVLLVGGQPELGDEPSGQDFLNVGRVPLRTADSSFQMIFMSSANVARVRDPATEVGLGIDGNPVLEQLVLFTFQVEEREIDHVFVEQSVVVGQAMRHQGVGRRLDPDRVPLRFEFLSHLTVLVLEVADFFVSIDFLGMSCPEYGE